MPSSNTLVFDSHGLHRRFPGAHNHGLPCTGARTRRRSRRMCPPSSSHPATLNFNQRMRTRAEAPCSADMWERGVDWHACHGA